MYQTKVFTREMKRLHGKIFVWTFKGEIYIRKNRENAPRVKIDNELDLNKIRKGTLLLDPPTALLPDPPTALLPDPHTTAPSHTNIIANAPSTGAPIITSVTEFPQLENS